MFGTSEEVGEFDWKDDGFFQCLLGSFQTRNIAPFDVRLLHHDGTCKHRHRAQGTRDQRRNEVGRCENRRERRKPES